MFYFLAGLGVLLLGIGFLNWLANTAPKNVAYGLFLLMGFALLIGAGILAFAGRYGLTVPMILGAWLSFRRYLFMKGLWDQFKGKAGRFYKRAPQAQSSRPRDRKEALEILGLQEGATKDEIIHAHRELMQKFHPDKGGNSALASQINAAKEYLIGK